MNFKNKKGAQTTKVVSLFSGRKGAMEMSVGTIVTIVLLMAVLVLGLVLVQKIFSSSTNAVENVDSQIQDQITKLFQDEGGTLAIYPSSRDITLKKKDDVPKGFAFAVKNGGTDTASYSFIVVAEDVSKCGSSFTKEKADLIILGGKGSFTLLSGKDTISNRDIVKFVLDDSVPLCTIIYRLHLCKGSSTCTVDKSTESASIFVTVK